MSRWPQRTMRERFDAKWMAEPNSGCWLWTAHVNEDGYGMFGVVDLVGQRQYIDRAHRVSWALHRGAVPSGTHVLHSCDNRACVNPAHLFLGTNQDNVDDKMRKGRCRVGSLRGEEHSQALLTEDDVIAIRSIWRGNVVGQAEIATAFGIKQTTVSAIVRRATWAHV